MRRFLTSTIFSTILLGATAMQATPAEALIIPPSLSTVACNAAADTIIVNFSTLAGTPDFYSRIWIYSFTENAYVFSSGWEPQSGSVAVVGGVAGTGGSGNVQVSAPSGNYYVYVQIAWHDGAVWQVPTNGWVTSYTYVPPGSRPLTGYNQCYIR